MFYDVLNDRGDNVMSADNQQERIRTEGWVVGFVDGEGTFSVTVQCNREMSLGWQMFPEFVVTQGKRSLDALLKLQEFFGYGKIFKNTRYDNHREDIFRYCVRRIDELEKVITPFFIKNPLKTSKSDDFQKFVKVIELMKKGDHLNFEGLRRIAEMAQTMNRRKPSRFLLSSETIRRTP